MSCYEKIVDSILPEVEKPGRYTGGEYNTPDMTKACKVRVCMCFPAKYEVGMSNLGIRILYHMLNSDKDIVAERCFAVEEDFADKLKKNKIPLLSLETKKPLKDFDILGISVQFELLYTNILYMLDLAEIPFKAADRDQSYPIIIGGGPCSVSPEPFADFLDIIVIGDGEDAMTALVNLYKEHKSKDYDKTEFLKAASEIEGVYIPAFAEVENTGRFVTVVKNKFVRQTFVKDFENAYFPTAIQVANIEAVHDRPVLELFRGCPNGCRFCQAGFFYRPLRARSADKIVKQAEESIDKTGFDEISLASLSTGDYTHIENVVESLYNLCESKGVNLSLPSLRMDTFTGDITVKSRLCSLTFAPEAGTQRLRDIINKNITDEDIYSTIREAFKAGYSSVKLYFMIGLPEETNEDLDGIREMVLKIKSIYGLESKGRALNINISAAVFVPKPLTPFQWEKHIDYDLIVKRQEYLRKALKMKGVRLSWHDYESARLETVLARGDRRLADVLITAYRKGAKFESWTEHFNYKIWTEAFREHNIDINTYLDGISLDERLPWDFIDFYVSKDYLIKERNEAAKGVSTKSCKKGCQGCSDNIFRCGV